MQISMNVLWTLIYVPMEFVKTCEVATVVIATVAMSQMPLGETALVSDLFYIYKSLSYRLIPLIRGETGLMMEARIPLVSVAMFVLQC